MRAVGCARPSRLAPWVWGVVWAIALLAAVGAVQAERLAPGSAPARPGTTTPSFVEAVRIAAPAVVQVESIREFDNRGGPGSTTPGAPSDQNDRWFDHQLFRQPLARRQRIVSSGFVLSPDGYVLTRRSAVRDGARVVVRLAQSPDREYAAKLVGFDSATDLALLKITPQTLLPAVVFASESDRDLGEWVIAIGLRPDLNASVTAGIISAKGRIRADRPQEPYVRTDAAVSASHAGGPLINHRGEVVGVNIVAVAGFHGQLEIGYALPIDTVQSVAAQLKKNGKVARAYLGIGTQPMSAELYQLFGLDEPKGALVAAVDPGSPAQKAGLRRGDVVLQFDDVPIKDGGHLARLVRTAIPGQQVRITLQRDGKSVEMAVTLGERSATSPSAASGADEARGWGMTVAQLTPDLARRYRLEDNTSGIVVTRVEADSPAVRAGVRRGDVIQRIDREEIETVEQFAARVKELGDGSSVLLLVRQRGVPTFVVLQKQP